MGRKGWMKWTPQEVDALRKLADSGYTLTEVYLSRVFKNRTRESIANASRAHDISLAGPSGEIDEDIFKKMIKEKLG
jgi:hypothetical protein